MPTAAEIANGTFQLTLTTTGNGTCPGSSATIQITLAEPFAQVGLAPVDAGCANSNDGSISVTGALPGWTYTWNTNPVQTTAVATGLTAGTFTVTITDPSGCDTSLTTVVSAPAPISIAGLSGTDESCAGLGDGSASATAIGGTPPYAYLWNNGGTTQQITVGAGTWTVQVTDANGCAPATGSIVVNSLGQPNAAYAGPDMIGCLNALPLTLSGTVTNATSGVWSGGAGTWTGTGTTAQYQPSTPEILAGQVTLVLTTTGNGSCPAATDSVLVTLSNSFVNASLSGTMVNCHGGSTGSAVFLPALPGHTYQWSPGTSTTNTATGLGAGLYQVHVTDVLGCDTVMTIPITQPPPLVATITAQQDPLCAATLNGSATVAASGGIPGYQFQWSPSANGQNTPTAIGLGGGLHTVVVTDGNGCTVQAQLALTTPAAITLTANVPDTICVNAPVQLSASASGGQGGHVFTWSGIGTGSPITHSFSASQSVVVSVVDAAGCPGPILTLPVTVLDLAQATFTTYGDTTVCPGGSAMIGAQLTGYPGSYVIDWPGLGVTGPGPFNVSIPASSVYPVVVSDACGNSLQGQVQVVLEMPPVISLPPIIAQGCAPLVVTMPPIQSVHPLTYSWQLGNGTGSADPTPTATYQQGQFEVSLVVSTPAGCTASSGTPGLVIAHPSPVAAFVPTPWTASIDNASFEFSNQSAGNIVATEWEFGDGATSNVINPTHTYQNIGSYPVELWVQNQYGCTDSVTRMIVVTPVYDIVVPNVFTPNTSGGNGGIWDPADLSNDIFYPFIEYVEDFRMRIFNRWGELIYETQDLGTGWDGWYRGVLSPQDVYVYQLWVRFVDGKETVRLGDVTLLR